MPKAVTEIRSIARSHTATAIKVLAGIMASKTATPAARIAAATAILDRGWGRPQQTGNVDGAKQLIERIERFLVDPPNTDRQGV